MSTKFKHIKVKNDDMNDTKKNHKSQITLRKSKEEKGKKNSTTNEKNIKLNKTICLEDRKKRKSDEYEDNPKVTRFKSQAKRKATRIIDEEKESKRTSTSFEKRAVKTKNVKETNNKKDKNANKAFKRIKTERYYDDNEDSEEESQDRKNRKKIKNDVSKQELRKSKEPTVKKNGKNGEAKITKFKKDGENKDKDKAPVIKSMKKKSKKEEEEEERKKKERKKKMTAGKTAGTLNNKKNIDNQIKKATDTKKNNKKKKESESSSGSGSKSSSRSSSSSSSKSKSSKNSESSSNQSSTPLPSYETSSDEDEVVEKKDTKKEQTQKTLSKSKTSVETNKNQKPEDKDKEKEKPKEGQQILANAPRATQEKRGSIIVGSQYLRRRSMDNPFTRERLELLVNQMTLKQNGGNTLFLRNYENGPSYEKDITFITKDKKTIQKHMKINECTKAGCSGPGIVKTNQDAYFVKENFLNNKEYFYVGVCDGHGEQGHVVSNYVINKLPQYIKDLSNESITAAFKKLNKEIYANSKMDSNMSGTTVVSLILTPNNIICVNLGDSRASLFRYENGLYYCRNLSRDHKPCEADESQRIINSGGRVKKCYDQDHKRFIGPDRVWVKNKEEPGLAMTRSLGDKIAHNVGVIDEPEFKTFTYDGCERFIIIASDGLWEYVNGDQCINIVRPFYEEGKDSREAALALTKEAFRKWKRKEVAIDDITVIVIFFD